MKSKCYEMIAMIRSSAARPNTRSVSAQNQVLNAPVSSGTRSRSSAATASGGNVNSRNRGKKELKYS